MSRCICPTILETDPLRHFKECPRREPLPEGHPAAPLDAAVARAERAEAELSEVRAVLAQGIRDIGAEQQNGLDIDSASTLELAQHLTGAAEALLAVSVATDPARACMSCGCRVDVEPAPGACECVCHPVKNSERARR